MAATPASTPEPAAPLPGMHFQDKWDWLIKVNSCGNLWKAQPSYLISQEVLLLGTLLTLIHSLVKKGRWPYLWLTGILLGTALELINYFTPDINNVWHSQTPVVLFGARLPLHVVFLYGVLLYHSVYAVSRLQLSRWREPFTCSLLVILLGMPYDIVSVKFLHMSWHDTDPNIGDRHYWVPWTLYLVRAVSTVSAVFFFQMVTRIFKSRTEKWVSAGFLREMVFSFVSCMVSIPVSLGITILIYCGMHDILFINTEVIFVLMMAIFIIITWNGDRTAKETVVARISKIDWLLLFHLFCHFGLYLALTIVGKPEGEVSIGLHEPIVACDKIQRFNSIFGTPLVKRPGLCIKDFNEDYYTFKCMSKKQWPKEGTLWYTICATPFRNRNEYIAIISGLCILAAAVFYNIYFKGFSAKQTAQLKKKNKTN